MLNHSKKLVIISWIGILLIIVVAAYMQNNMFIASDNAWLLTASQRFIDGGHYLHHFVESNPPMILYIYAIPVLIAKWFSLSLLLTFRVYIFFIGLVSLCYCYYLLNKIRPHFDYQAVFGLLLIAFSLFIMPVDSFGEREHILIMCVLPYLLLTVLYLQGNEVALVNKIIIAIMAGIGFSIVPYYVAAFVLVELYVMFAKRNFFSWVRVESLIICMVIFCYVASIFIVTPDYIQYIVPMVFHFYIHQYATYSISSVAQGLFVVYGALVLVLMSYKSCQQKYLIAVFMAAMLGMVAAYLWQQKIWYYHVYPCIVLAVIMTYFLVANQTQKISYHFMMVSLMRAVTFLICWFLCAFILYVMSGHFIASYNMHHDKSSLENSLLKYTEKYAHSSGFMVLSIYHPQSWLSMYSQAPTVTRFNGFWMLPGILKKAQTEPDNKQVTYYKNFVANGIIEDIAINKPSVIYIDHAEYKRFLGNIQFSFISFLDNYPRFKLLWKQYNYQGEISIYAVYLRKKH